MPMGILHRVTVEPYVSVLHLDGVAGQADDTFYEILGAVGRKNEDHHVAAMDRLEIHQVPSIRQPRDLEPQNRVWHADPVDHLVDQNVVADEQSRLHGARGNFVRLDKERANEDRKHQRDCERFGIFARRRFLPRGRGRGTRAERFRRLQVSYWLCHARPLPIFLLTERCAEARPSNWQQPACVTVPRPVNDQRPPFHVVLVGESPIPAVLAVIAVVSHHKQAPGGDFERPSDGSGGVHEAKVVARNVEALSIGNIEVRMWIVDGTAIKPYPATFYLNLVSGQADHPLDQILIALLWMNEHDHITAVDSSEVQ